RLTDLGGLEAGGNYKVAINWGDNTPLDTSSGSVNGSAISGSHTYAEEGSYPVSVTITDDGGQSTSTTSQANVADAALSASGTPVSATEGQPFSGALGTLTDLGALEAG